VAEIRSDPRPVRKWSRPTAQVAGGDNRLVEDIVISLVIAGLGSLAAFLIALGSRWLRNRGLRKRYPVAGRFITEYEDEVDGHRVLQKAMTTLEQWGRDVTGATADLSGERAWLLKGTIESGGFLHGVYSAEDPHDSGKGTFFMKIDGASGDLQGLWAGFDSKNGSIREGSYDFKRCPEATIEVASDSDAPTVCALLGDALGELYVDLNEIRSIIATENPDATCLIAVDREGQIIGALTAAMFSNASLGAALPAGQAETIGRLPAIRYHERFCVIRSIAVVPRWRDRGVGSRLVREALTWCGARGTTAALSFGWKSSRGCHIDGVMTTTGFDRILEVPNFWTADSQAKDYFCPECGSVCECAAVVFKRVIDVKAASSTSAA
jgi:GNAT superfamily N-acetyltransferase